MFKILPKLLVVVLCVGVVAVAGCKSKTAGIDKDKIVEPEILPGDNPLPGWTEKDMDRVPDVQLEKVYFAYDSFVVENSEFRKIQKAAEYMKTNPSHRLVTEGNCDERGTREYNMALGENRAGAVRTRLIECGIPGEKILTKSYGEDNPAEPSHSEAAWKKNRRVEFAVYRPKK